MSDWDLAGKAITLADRDDACGFSAEHDIGGHVQATELQGTQPNARDVLRHHVQREEAVRRRKELLRLRDGDLGLLDVERYTLGVLATQIVPGGAGPRVISLSGSQRPDVAFRIQRVTANPPSPGFVMLFTMKLGNVTSIVSNTGIDAWQINATAWEEEMDLPTLTPENAMSFTGNYTGLQVSPFKDVNFQFVLAGSGPAEKVPFGEDLNPSEPI